MKKLFTLSLMMLLMASAAFAQSTHTIDFEPNGIGADWTWIMDQNADNPPLEFVANPSGDGINTSATVAKFTARATGQAWALCITEGDGEFTFDNTNAIVKMMVYKSKISDVGFKLEGGTAKEIKVANTKTNEWEELTFDFSSEIGKTFSKIVIIPDFESRSENIIYFDNIQIPDGVVAGPLAEPTVGAPTPTVEQANVTSIYSDTYTAPGSPNYNPGWGQSTVMEGVEIDGNQTIKYTGLTYQGNTFDAIDASEMGYLHVDYWTPNGTVLRVSPINTSIGKEAAYNFGALAKEQWVSVDIPLSHFTGANPELSFAAIDQLKFDSEGTPGVFSLGTFYVDNIYFYKATSTNIGNAKVEKLALYPNPVYDVLRFQNVEEGSAFEIFGATGRLAKSGFVQGGSVSVADLNQGVYFVKVNGLTAKIIKK